MSHCCRAGTERVAVGGVCGKAWYLEIPTGGPKQPRLLNWYCEGRLYLQASDLGSELCESGQEQGYKQFQPMGHAPWILLPGNRGLLPDHRAMRSSSRGPISFLSIAPGLFLDHVRLCFTDVPTSEGWNLMLASMAGLPALSIVSHSRPYKLMRRKLQRLNMGRRQRGRVQCFSDVVCRPRYLGATAKYSGRYSGCSNLCLKESRSIRSHIHSYLYLSSRGLSVLWGRPPPPPIPHPGGPKD